MTEIISDTHVFFWHGIYSQWHYSDFTAPLWRGAPPIAFQTAEQYMMASKAILFGDVVGSIAEDGSYVPSTLEKILAAKTPREQKALGREVKNFDEARWRKHAKSIVFRGTFSKFSQDAVLQNELHLTGKRSFVEGSPYDKIWGVGLQYDDPKILNPQNWDGLNWLGEVLTVVRDTLALIEGTDQTIDIFTDDPFM